jgi:proteasome alpha subunit
MPFYVSPEQSMKDKADYARKAISRIRSGVVIACDAGILFIAPNPSRALRKFSEIYDRVRYADITGFQYDRQDVTARGLANYYAQVLGTFFTDSPKPYEVELVVAEVGKTADDDQIYRITFDGSVADERGFVVIGGQADQVAAVLKEQYSDGMTLAEAFTVAIAALAGPVKGEGEAGGGRSEITAAQLEVALLDRGRAHRAFRRLTGPRLESLLTEAITGKQTEAITEAAADEESGDGAHGAEGAGAPETPETPGGAK